MTREASHYLTRGSSAHSKAEIMESAREFQISYSFFFFFFFFLGGGGGKGAKGREIGLENVSPSQWCLVFEMLGTEASKLAWGNKDICE